MEMITGLLMCMLATLSEFLSLLPSSLLTDDGVRTMSVEKLKFRYKYSRWWFHCDNDLKAHIFRGLRREEKKPWIIFFSHVYFAVGKRRPQRTTAMINDKGFLSTLLRFFFLGLWLFYDRKKKMGSPKNVKCFLCVSSGSEMRLRYVLVKRSGDHFDFANEKFIWSLRGEALSKAQTTGRADADIEWMSKMNFAG